MDKKNKLFLGLLALGFVAIMIGANHKVNGNENAFITLTIGMVLKSIAILSLIFYNFSKLKTILK